MFVLCVLSKDKKAKYRTIKTKTETNTDEVQSTREYKKKIPVVATFSAPAQTDPGATQPTTQWVPGLSYRAKAAGAWR